MERQRLWVLVSIGVLASCAADSARVAVERSSEREQHRLAAEVFVQHASAGNVSELLTLMANVLSRPMSRVRSRRICVIRLRRSSKATAGYTGKGSFYRCRMNKATRAPNIMNLLKPLMERCTPS